MHEKRFVYVVMGETGEYSDRSDWPVRAFLNEGIAQALINQLDEWLRVHGFDMGERAHINLERRHPLPTCELDPSFACDYTGTRYYLLTIELEDAQ